MNTIHLIAPYKKITIILFYSVSKLILTREKKIRWNQGKAKKKLEVEFYSFFLFRLRFLTFDVS